MTWPGPYRLDTGGRIDRSRIVTVRFDGVRVDGHPGDTLASALLANGVRRVARSFKYHRPRGVVTAGVDEPNALVQLVGADDEPNVRATTLAIRDGLEALSLNRWPSLAFDVGAVNDRLSALFPAGFYYKTFIGGSGWNLYGPIIRRFAGLGRAPVSAPAHRYEKRFHHCDLLVVGAGPSGLSAALTGARAGARVTLVDDGIEPGGQLLDLAVDIDGYPAMTWVDTVVAELSASPNVLRIARTTCTGYYDHNFLTLLETSPGEGRLHERLWKVRARRVLLCTGALERPLVFPGNDRPGVMQAHAALTYARRYGVMPGRRAVVITNNDSAYDTAEALGLLGLDVAAVVDVRAEGAGEALPGVECLRGSTLARVIGAHGVRSVDVARLDSAGRSRRIDCDLVLMSGGWNPLVHLASQTGARPTYAPSIASFVPGPPVQAESSAGAARGAFDLGDCLADGQRTAREALVSLGMDVGDDAPPPVGTPTTPLAIEPVWRLPRTRGAKAFVDFQNDVTDLDIDLAVRENLVSVEHVKRYTTAGMGTDQGKLGNINTIGLIAGNLGLEPGEVGTTSYRPPYVAVSFGAITGNDLGELVVPSRRTPMTDWIEARGAQMFEAGAAYRRPSYFPLPGEDMASSVAREARACRENLGIYDGSPLGKFELQGPDVVEFLERVYTNRWADLPVGQGRFGLMLREDGRMMDDGVTFRLGPHRYWMFCGTGAADHTLMHLERLLTLEWPDLEVYLLRVTSQWANVCVCGPRSRDVIAAAGTDVDLSLPFMAIREGVVAGIPARLARVGYTGELSFEVNVPSGRGLALWQALMRAGEPHGITPVGSEASMVMRCEKGFVAPGFEGDGIVNPYDAGLGWVVDETKRDFIGKRSLERDRNVGGMRPAVVGLLPDEEDFVPPDGTPIVDGREPDGMPAVVGYVSQGCFSPAVGRAIALAVLDDGRRRSGDSLTLAAKDRSGSARVVAPCFVDPGGTRMRDG